MATRSNIGIEYPDGKVYEVYCHWDGYPEHNGKILLEHYTTRESVEALILHGHISILDEALGEAHDFNKHGSYHGNDHQENWCLFYHRDRGEDLAMPTEHEDLQSVLTRMQEYAYIMTKDGQWVYSDHGKPFRPLTAKVVAYSS